MYPRILPKTETSCWDVGVTGVTDEGEVGVPLLTEMLEKAGARGTFYVDINAADYVGEEAVRTTCRDLIARGHDVQLHYHSHYEFSDQPNWRDLMYAQSPGSPHFPAAIELTANRFEALCGQRATCYRAGGYRIESPNLEALKAIGVRCEGTAWPDPGGRVALEEDIRWRNTPSFAHALLFMPITHYLELYPGRAPTIRQLNFSLDRRNVYEAILDLIDESDIQAVSLMSHSSTFMEYGFGPTYKELTQAIAEAHGNTTKERIHSVYADWVESQERPKLMVEKPHKQRIEEYRDFFEAVASRAHLQFITADEYLKKVEAGEIKLPERRRGLLPLPVYDFSTKTARMDYVRRYDLQRLMDLDDVFRDLPDDQSFFTKPPAEIAEQLKTIGIPAG